MGNVVSITTRRADEDTGWAVSVDLAIPANDTETVLPLAPVFEVLLTHLREPCVVISDEQAEARAKQQGLWPQEPLNVFDDMCGIRGLSYPLEAASERGNSLTVAENPEWYSPRFGAVRDEIFVQVSRRHSECGWSSDPWQAMACEDQMHLSLRSPSCGWNEEQQSKCGFELTLIVVGDGDQSESIATTIATHLKHAYNV